MSKDKSIGLQTQTWKKLKNIKHQKNMENPQNHITMENVIQDLIKKQNTNKVTTK